LVAAAAARVNQILTNSPGAAILYVRQVEEEIAAQEKEIQNRREA
jgi:hypothetical protein